MSLRVRFECRMCGCIYVFWDDFSLRLRECKKESHDDVYFHSREIDLPFPEEVRGVIESLIGKMRIEE